MLTRTGDDHSVNKFQEISVRNAIQEMGLPKVRQRNSAKRLEDCRLQGRQGEEAREGASSLPAWEAGDFESTQNTGLHNLTRTERI
jgi:hypothetical protein